MNVRRVLSFILVYTTLIYQKNLVFSADPNEATQSTSELADPSQGAPTQSATETLLTQTPNLDTQPAEDPNQTHTSAYPAGNLYPDAAEDLVGEASHSAEKASEAAESLDTAPANETGVITAEASAEPVVEAQPVAEGTAADQAEPAEQTVVDVVEQTVAVEVVAESATEEPANETHTDTTGVMVAEPVVDETLVEPLVEPEPEPPLPEVNGLKIVDLDIVNFENNHHVNHRFDRARNMHIFSCGSGHAFGLIKESFGPQELQYLPQDELYKSLTQLKNKNLLHLHTDNMVGGAYRWDDTLAFMDHLKKGTLELTLQEESLFVTVEVDKMEATTHLNYGFDNDNNLHIFAANSPFIIDSVMLAGEFVWVYDDDRNDKKFPVSVEFNGSDVIKMKFDKFFLTFTRKDNGRWAVVSDFYAKPQLAIEPAKETAPPAEEPAEPSAAATEQPVADQQPAAEEPANEDAAPEAAPTAEVDQHKAEEAVTPEANQQLALPEGEAEPVAEPVAEAAAETVAEPAAEPEALLDDHVVAALEFVWRQNPAALEVDAPKKPVYAESVYVRTTGNEKTLTIFFTDKTVKRFHRIGHLGPWRERVTRPKVRAVATHPRAKFEKTLEMFSSADVEQMLKLTERKTSLTTPEPIETDVIAHNYRRVSSPASKGIVLRDKPVAQRLGIRSGQQYRTYQPIVSTAQQALQYHETGQDARATTPPKKQSDDTGLSGQGTDGSGTRRRTSSTNEQDTTKTGGEDGGFSTGTDQSADADGTSPDPNQASSATLTGSSPESGSGTGTGSGEATDHNASSGGFGSSASATLPKGLSSKDNDQDGTGEPAQPASKIHIFIEDPQDSNNSIELDLSKILVGEVNKFQFVGHKLGDDVKCTEVKYKDESMWKFDSTKAKKYPKSVIWHESYYLGFLEFDDHYRFYTRGSDKKWKWEGMTNTDILDQTKVKLFTKEGNDLKELGSDQYEFNDLAFGYEYIFKDKANCHKLTYDGAPIFTYNAEANDGNYPIVLYVFSNRSGQVFYPGSSFSLNSPINIVLSLKDNTAGTSQFDYEKKSKVVTYTAKQGHGFAGVTTTSGGGSCCSNKTNVDIWKATDANDYATKVVLDGKGKSTKTVTIHLSNGTKKVFKKHGRNKEWKEQEVPQEQQAQVNTGVSQAGSRRNSTSGGDQQAGSRKNSTSGGDQQAGSRKNSTTSVSSLKSNSGSKAGGDQDGQ